MRRFLLPVLTAFFAVYIFGCGREKPAEDSYEAISIEEISAIEAIPDQAAQEEAAPPDLEPLPPEGPYKPAVGEIQAALKKAGFYTGPIDGKSGPLTREATEEFQESHGLKMDGKVGPKTWAVLSGYLPLEDE